MSVIQQKTDVSESVTALETFFRSHLGNEFEIGISKSAHYKNGSPEDLCGGCEFQFYRPASASSKQQHAAHRVRFSRTFLEDDPKEVLIERLGKWGLIGLLKRNGESALSVSKEGVVNDHL